MRDTLAQERFYQQSRSSSQPSSSFYTEQRRKEYSSFAQEYVKPVVETAIEEKKEEELISPEEARKKFEEDLQKSYEEAKREAEEQIKAERERAWKEFLENLERKREEYREELIRKRIQQLGAEATIFKRRQAVQGYYSPPKEYAKAKKSVLEKYKEDLAEAIKEWEQKEKAKASSSLSEWEKTAREETLADLQQQMEEKRKEFETALAKAIMEGVPQQAPSLAEQYLKSGGWNLWEALGLIKKQPSPFQQPSMGDKSLAAGFIGSLESLVYSISDIGGFLLEGLGVLDYEPTWHPAYPPTVTGALLTSGIESIQAGKLKKSGEFQQLETFAPSPILYSVGSVAGDILGAYVLGKAAGFVGSGVKKGVLKGVGAAEKILAPEHYYYYKHILQKPMLTTMSKEALKDVAQNILGMEAYQYLAKIGLPHVKETLISSSKALRKAAYKTPLGEAYLYGKAVWLPTMKYETKKAALDLSRTILGMGTKARGSLMASHLAEPYLYAKAVALPRAEDVLKGFSAVTRKAFLGSPLGEAWIYTKSVKVPYILQGLQKLPKMPKFKIPYILKGGIAEAKVYGKSLLGKKYVSEILKPSFSHPMKPLWLPKKTVAFPKKPFLTPTTSSTVAKTIMKPSISRAAIPPSSVSVLAGGSVAETILHGWKGTPYPSKVKKRRRRIIEEEMFIFSGFEVGKPARLSTGKPKQISLPKLLGLTGMGAKTLSSQIMGAGVKQISLSQTKLKEEQMQRLRLQQLQAQRMQQLKMKKKLLKKEHKKRKAIPDLYGLLYGEWVYPVATSKQALSVLIMPKNNRGRRR